MIAAAGALAVLSGLLAAQPAQTIVLEERFPVALLLLSGNVEERSAFGVSELVRDASAALARHTSLYLLPEVKSAADESIASCEEQRRLRCWMHAVAGDRRDVRYLLAVSFFHDPRAGDRVSTLLVDLAEAFALEGSAGGAEDERLEDAIFQRAARTSDVLPSGEGALAEYFEALIGEKLRDRFAARGYFEPYGRIELTVEQGGLELELDDAPIGTTRAGVNAIEGVLPGKRRLAVIDPRDRAARFDAAVVVSARATAAVAAPKLGRGDAAHGTLGADLTFWTGIGLAGAGAALAGWAVLADPRPLVFDGCFGPECGDHRSFVTFCELTARDASCLGGGGLRVLPLGYSLALSCAIFAAGAELFGDDGDVPWIAVAAGIAAGALAYGVSAALDRDRATPVH